MYLFAIALLIFVVSHGNCYSKCCKTEDYLAETNSGIRCLKNKLNRMYILTNDSDFLQDNYEGECVDVSSDFFLFNVSKGVILSKSPINQPVFPKCCPVNYTYNTILHACEESDVDFGFISEHFIKVGLPSCEVIVDHELNELNNIYYEPKYPTSSESYCIDKNEKGSFIYRECKKDVDMCAHIRCIKKCCPDGQSFINRSQCLNTYTRGLKLSTFSNVDRPEEPYAIISNRSCPAIFKLNNDIHTYNLDSKGVFHFWHKKSKSFLPFAVSDMKSYCIEHTQTPTITGYLFFMCFLEQSPVEKFVYTVWPKILSCVFLVATVLVYIILRETRNVFGKILMNYCAALFFNNAVLTYSQINLHPSYTNCIVRGFSLIFFVSASFCWSNVMCCDIYRTFGSMQQNKSPRSRNIKKLLWYLLYGWGVPTALTLLIFLFYYYKVLPNSIQPYLAEKRCFFERKEGNYAQALFFNIPYLIIQLVNTIFFIKTIIYCLRVKNEINRVKDTLTDERNKRFQKDKEKLFLILKLWIIMGISFMFEVVSSFFVMKEMGTTAKYIEIIFDTINCLQGVFIFIIFICKKKIYNDLHRKFTSVPRNISMSSVSTQTTSISSRLSKKRTNS